MTAQRSSADPSDDGISLVELIVVIAVGALIAGLMAGIFISGIRSQAATRDRDMATGKAQVVTDLLQTSIRNAGDVRTDGTTLWARVATDESGWECRAWSLTDAGNLVYAHGPSALGPVDESNGVELISTQDGVQGASVGVSTADDEPLFREVNGQIDYAFAVTIGDATVRVAGSVMPQAEGEGATISCEN